MGKVQINRYTDKIISPHVLSAVQEEQGYRRGSTLRGSILELGGQVSGELLEEATFKLDLSRPAELSAMRECSRMECSRTAVQ